MLVVAIEHEAFRQAAPDDLPGILRQCQSFRRNGVQVVRLEPQGERVNVSEAVNWLTLGFGLDRRRRSSPEFVAIVACSVMSWEHSGDVMTEAIAGARDWEADTLLVIGPHAYPVEDEHLGFVHAFRSLTKETVRLAAGVLGEPQSDYFGQDWAGLRLPS